MLHRQYTPIDLIFKAATEVYITLMQQQRGIFTIAKEFNLLMWDLITMIERKSRSEMEMANLDRFKKRISLLKSTVGDIAPIQLTAPFFISFSENILNPDMTERDKFFLDMNVRAEYSRHMGAISKQDEFAFELSDSVRAHYKNLSVQERDDIYKKVVAMLRCAIEYKLIAG